MPSRRDFLWGGVAGAAALLAGCRPLPRRGRRGPRYWVQLLLSGGHDTLFTTDPKQLHEVDSMVRLPSNPTATDGPVAFGPHFAKLARWAPQLAVVNGVQVRTVNHDTGDKQFFHLRTNINEAMPTALDAITASRDEQPLGVAYLGLTDRAMHSPAYFGTADKFYFGTTDIFDLLARFSPPQLGSLARVLRRRAGELGRGAPALSPAAQSERYLREVADFVERAAHVPALVTHEVSSDYVAQAMAVALDRVVWLLEHDLCSGVVVDLGVRGWDSHIRNESTQAEMNGNFATFFDGYLEAIHHRRNAHGPLAENTVTIVGSELGRFPRENDMLGKDHLPQTSFLFAGPGIRSGATYGRTGRQLEGLPISYADGRVVANAGRVPMLDDLGATMLHLAGLDPECFGNTGEVCRFLLARGA